MRKDIVRIDIQHPVQVFESPLVVAQLGHYQAAVVEGQSVARLVPEHAIEIRHCLAVLFLLVVHQGAVEIGKGVRSIYRDRLIHILYRKIQPVLCRVKPPPADIAFGVETVETYGLVVVGHRLERVTKEKIGCTAIEICRRVLRFFADVAVEILHCVVEPL